MPTTTTDRNNLVAIIIPCRMESKRLPWKPLLEAGGKALVQWTYERARRCRRADYVLVACEAGPISQYCQDNHMLWIETRDDHPTGTHRVVESLGKMAANSRVGIVVNWQCDEPLVQPRDVDRLIVHQRSSVGSASTLVARLEDEQADDEHETKVAVDIHGRCRWFSRAPMRGALGHCGVYAFRSEQLRRIGRLSPTPLSMTESLEQIAWLEGGLSIDAVDIRSLPLSINTSEDWEKFKETVE